MLKSVEEKKKKRGRIDCEGKCGCERGFYEGVTDLGERILEGEKNLEFFGWKRKKPNLI